MSTAPSNQITKETPPSGSASVPLRRESDSAVLNKASLASFDVFDTVLTRVTGTPEGVFLLLGRLLSREGVISCSPQAFAAARDEAERRAYRNSPTRQTTLEQIYFELQTALGLSAEQAANLVRVELELEDALIRTVPAMAAEIERMRAAGKRIIFISDMYMDEDVIRKLLQRRGLLREGDGYYVSSEWNRSKRSGKLFKAALAAESIPARRVIHWGNSTDHDIRPPRSLGMMPRHFTGANRNRYETLLAGYGVQTEGFSELLAGASKMARLSVAVAGTREAVIRDVTAGVGAPMIAGYLLWLLSRARDSGLERLYFMTREGQFLAEAARRLAGRLSYSCDIRYLPASRYVWQPASLFQIDGKTLDWIFENRNPVTLRDILKRLGIPADEVADLLEAGGFSARRWGRPLSESDIRSLRSIFSGGKIKAVILRHAAQKRRVLTEYLRQECLFQESVRYAVADLGWRGSCQDVLNRILAAEGFSPVSGYYFGLDSRTDAVTLWSKEAYFFNAGAGFGYLRDFSKDMVALPEMFTLAGHGLLTDYASVAGRIIPVFDEEVNEPAFRWGLGLMRRTVESFIDHLILDENLTDFFTDLRPAVMATAEEFWRRPTLEELSVWGSFPVESHSGGLFRYRAGEPYRAGEAVNTLKNGFITPPCPRAWGKAVSGYTPRPVLAALGAALALNRFLRGIRAAVRLFFRRLFLRAQSPQTQGRPL